MKKKNKFSRQAIIRQATIEEGLEESTNIAQMGEAYNRIMTILAHDYRQRDIMKELARFRKMARLRPNPA